MAGLNGLQIPDDQTYLRKPETYHHGLEGLKSKIFQDSVMEPGFIESLTAPEGSPIDYQNIESTAGGRAREMFVDPMRRFGGAIVKGMTGKPLTIGDQLNLIEGMIDTTVGGLFQHGLSKGGFDPNTLHMFVGPKAKDIVKAEKMALRGASPAEIQSKLLMHKKPDGFWRKEISDAGMITKDNLRTPNEVYSGLERDILTGKGEGMGDVLKNLEPYRDMTGDQINQLVGERQSIIDNALATSNFEGVREALTKYKGVQMMATGIKDRTSGKLGDYIEHPELFKEYPEMKDMFTERKYDLGKYGGTYTPTTEFSNPKLAVKAQASKGIEKPVYAHELQHGVQDTEKWARGGNIEEFAREKASAMGRIKFLNDDLSMFAKSIDDAAKGGDTQAVEYYKKLYDETMTEKMSFVDKAQADPFERYQNLLGEREARSTAERLGMSLEQRRGLVPDLGEGAQVIMR